MCCPSGQQTTCPLSSCVLKTWTLATRALKMNTRKLCTQNMNTRKLCTQNMNTRKLCTQNMNTRKLCAQNVKSAMSINSIIYEGSVKKWSRALLRAWCAHTQFRLGSTEAPKQHTALQNSRHCWKQHAHGSVIVLRLDTVVLWIIKLVQSIYDVCGVSTRAQNWQLLHVHLYLHLVQPLLYDTLYISGNFGQSSPQEQNGAQSHEFTRINPVMHVPVWGSNEPIRFRDSAATPFPVMSRNSPGNHLNHWCATLRDRMSCLPFHVWI